VSVPAGAIQCVRFSADGRFLFAPGADHVVLCLDVRDGSVCATYCCKLADISCLALSPDGRLLATGDEDGAVDVYDRGSARSLWRDRGAARPIRSLQFCPDSTVLVSLGDDGWAMHWGAGDGARLERKYLEPGGILTGAVSADCEMFATVGRERLVRLWDHADYGKGRQLPGSGARPSAMRFACEGACLLVCDEEGSITAWSTCDGKRVASFPSVPGSEEGGFFDAQGWLCVWAGRRRAVVRSLPTGDIVAALDLEGPATAVALHAATGQVAVGSAGGALTVWQTDGPGPGRVLLREGRPVGVGTAPPPLADENVQFTAFRPETVRPAEWYPLLAFAHLSARRPDAREDEPDPIEEVKRQARTVLGERADEYREVTQDSRQAVPREGELVFVPEMEGVEFNPPRRSFLWLEPVHREEFRFRAAEALTGKTARGSLTVYLGSILLAEVSLSIRVASTAPARTQQAPTAASSARPYRKIFASYSHRDAHIVEECQVLARVLGDRYLRDCLDLNAGETWSERLEALIEEADVFQLFWSSNSMRSDFVRQEWEYALSLQRASFVRPTYWEVPLPEDPARDLPPDALRRLHFQVLGVGPVPHGPAPIWHEDREITGASQESAVGMDQAAEEAEGGEAERPNEEMAGISGASHESSGMMCEDAPPREVRLREALPEMSGPLPDESKHLLAYVVLAALALAALVLAVLLLTGVL